MQGDPAQRPQDPEVITFYALGDWGTGEEQQMAVAEALRKNVAEIPKGKNIPPFVLGLGDNIYENGLPLGWNNRQQALTLLKKTFGEIYKDVKYDGQNLIFNVVPGNHDYNNQVGGKKGWGDILHQETTAEQEYPNWKYYPINHDNISDTNDSTEYSALRNEDIFSLTLPEKINSSKTISLVAVDTQVFLELYQNQDTTKIKNHWKRLEKLLHDETDWKIIAGHHPVKSHGRHGGFRTWVWWIPPIFLFTTIDKLFIKPLQDLDNPASRRFQKDFFDLMKKHKVHIYLAGHEHSLQFLRIDSNNFQIISGSAAKLSPVTHKNDTLFSHAAPGFVRFDVTKKEIWVEFFQVDSRSASYRSTALFKITK
jgi:hypothetical protein